MRAAVSIGDVWAELEDDTPYSRDHANELLAACSAEVIRDYEASVTIGDPRPEDAT